jgi:hypothetical protein
MSIVTGYKIGNIDLGSIFVNQTGGATVTGYKNSSAADLGALFRNQTGGTRITGYKTSTGADLGTLFALAPLTYETINTFFEPQTILNHPVGMCIDTNYNLFIANNWAVNNTGTGTGNGYLSKLNTDGTPALTNLPNNTTPTQLAGCKGICIDNNNNVYATSIDNKAVYKCVPPYTTLTTTDPLITTDFAGTNAVAVDNSGNVFVASSSGFLSVYLIGSIGTKRPIITPAGTITYLNATTGTTKASELSLSIYAIFINGDKLYVCNGINGCICSFSVSNILSSDAALQYGNARMTKFAGTGVNGGVTAYPSPTLATSSNLTSTYGMCFDSMGNTYITDRSAGSIKKNDTLGYISMVVGPTTSTGDGSAPLKYNFDPGGMCIKSTNNYLYVADITTSKIHEVK